ncbi:hypothetical protein DCAR_0209200 [Daucus carota subsp. sativus]|uniref:F-box domain-containing protein n=1 Tax=Daucus carota subsp. sativus TaxID=79200 RepID=A0AAF0WHW3_DAUCS|nr:PREDICTED: uncharacterized protein LOC108209894 isoform X2 [Daucus carota subsp. sativus]WOG89959.1 hypothetical protein DCAR_0209200 [Daucus carota subsp. sativus]
MGDGRRLPKKKRIRGGAKYMTMNDGCVRNSAEMVVDRWLDLPSGPLGQIFSKLNPIDVILVIPLVCKYWGQIFLKELFFLQEDGKCLDFSPLVKEPFYSYFCQSGDENVRAKRLMTLIVGLLHAFTFGSENDSHNSAARPASITDINICAALPFHDRHLVYIAERCPELTDIQLPCMKNITGKGMSRAMRCWSCMDRMMCGPFNNLHLPRIIQEIGVNYDKDEDAVKPDFMIWNVQEGRRTRWGLEIYRDMLEPKTSKGFADVIWKLHK